MALIDPVAIYNAASNLQATLVCEMLRSKGIEAHCVEDVSQVGVWMFGLLPEIHKPQVWVERNETQRAEQLLEVFESKKDKLRNNGPETTTEVFCEECGETSVFPSSRIGAVETCPHCSAYVDVGSDVEFDDWNETVGEDIGSN